MTNYLTVFAPISQNPMVNLVSQHPTRTKLGPFCKNSDQLPYEERKNGPKKSLWLRNQVSQGLNLSLKRFDLKQLKF